MLARVPLMNRENMVEDLLINLRRWMMVNGLNKHFNCGASSSVVSRQKLFSCVKSFKLFSLKICAIKKLES